jgi:Tol biopolymer transport system component
VAFLCRRIICQPFSGCNALQWLFKEIPMRLLTTLLLAAGCCFAQQKQGDPLDNLPGNIEVLTHFGERADFSSDGTEVAFMAKSFGDAFVIDLKTRAIRCLTCNVPGAAFLRVMHLVNGDYLLIGPEKFVDIRASRGRDNELWYLSRRKGSKPVRLEQKMSEGSAVSKRSLTVAFSITSTQDSEMAPGSSKLVVADIDPAAPALRNLTVILESPDRKCFIEAQDFFDNDGKLTYSCYEPEGRASVWTIDRRTRQTTNHSKAIGSYNEPEGILPGGEYTLVESDRQAVLRGKTELFRDIDIWKLRLDGTGRDFTRLTNFNDYAGGKASNPVVSPDGRYMAFQLANTADEAGVGYGILLYRFR